MSNGVISLCADMTEVVVPGILVKAAVLMLVEAKRSPEKLTHLAAFSEEKCNGFIASMRQSNDFVPRYVVI